jgi:MerR family transcriptional regulator, thiopeptide resistance regulator
MDEPGSAESASNGRSLTVGAVARMASITVRTLHHYDEIGLLRPSVRTDAGYRRYTNADLERLQQILFYRQLGFALDEIESVMTNGGITPVAHLRRQHTLLLDRIARLRRMANAVEKAMEARQMGIQLTPQERLEVFGDFDPDAHTDEVNERWGQTDAYRESARRAAQYTADDWRRMKEESGAVTMQAVEAMQAGMPADSAEAMDAAEAHRQQISRWFYECSYEMHVGLAEMYIADPRFTATYEKIAPGLAQYLHDAILANAARAGA